MKFRKSTLILFILFSFLLSGMLAWFVDGRAFDLSSWQHRVLALVETLKGKLSGREEQAPLPPLPQATDIPVMIGHHGIGYRCTAGAATGIEELPAGRIYKWRDAEGGVHYGDNPPRNVPVEMVDFGYREKDFFDLKVRFPAGSVPANIRDEIDIGGTAVYQVYRDFLSLERMSKASIDVLVYGNSASYQAYRRQIAPKVSASTNGFYSWSRNQAVVLHRGDTASTRRTAVHEATHVINARNFGLMPRWFNEGTAEFFEQVRVRGQQVTVDYDSEWVSGLGRQYPLLPLVRLLNSGDEDWDGEDGSTFYANAWALIFFLMLPDNAPVMRALQLELARDKCDEIDSALFMAEHYAGGLAVLERDWRRWLRGAHKQAIRF